jgi:hypothetical protein
MVSLLREQRVKPSVVGNKKLAKSMTSVDLFGHIWAKGDEYYVAYTPKKRFLAID